MTYPADMINS